MRNEYYESNGLSAIDVIEAYDLDFNLGNVIKYVLRAGRKPHESKQEALAKALDYLERAVDSACVDSWLAD